MRRYRLLIVSALFVFAWFGCIYFAVRGVAEAGGLRCVVLGAWEGKLPQGCGPR